MGVVGCMCVGSVMMLGESSRRDYGSAKFRGWEANS